MIVQTTLMLIWILGSVLICLTVTIKYIDRYHYRTFIAIGIVRTFQDAINICLLILMSIVML